MRRGASIYAEIVGYGCNSDGSHITRPQKDTMYRAMEIALQQSGLAPESIGYVSAHGTSTDQGDVAETHATNRLLGNKIPISALKSFTGHTLGACGALEAFVTINMMNESWFHGTANLENVDPICAELDYLPSEGRKIETNCVMSNNFAFGGINTSLIFIKEEK